MYRFLWLLWVAVFVRGCEINGYFENVTASFTNTAFSTLVLVETYLYTGTDCSTTIIASPTVEAGGLDYTVDPSTLTPAGGTVEITYRFTNLTLATLAAVAPTVTYFENWAGTTQELNGLQIILPTSTTTTATTQRITSTSSRSTSTFGTTSSSVSSSISSQTTATVVAVTTNTGIQSSTIGGIVGGIVGGLLLLGALIFFFLRRNKSRSSRRDVDYTQSPEMQPAEVEEDKYEPVPDVQRVSLKYPELGEVGGRTQGGYY